MPPESASNNTIQRIAVFLPNWVGDVVMATPTLRALRARYAPPVQIIGILRPHLAELLAGTKWLDELWLFDPRTTGRHFGRLGLIWHMRRRRADLAVLLTNSLHTALLARLGGAAQTIGYARNCRSFLLTKRLYPPRVGGRILAMPMVDYYLAIAEALGCSGLSRRLELPITDAQQEQARVVWRRLGLRSDGRVVAFVIGAAWGPSKLWPTEYFAQLARRVVDTLDCDVLVVCGPQERQMARQVVAAAQRLEVASLADEALSLGLVKACLQRCLAAVCTDSGPRHIAAALGKPVLTLFGPTSPVWVDNPTVEAVNLQLPLDCTGCRQRRCPLGHHRCMRDILPESVYQELVGMLQKRQATRLAA
jgi:heptosyltransferase-2